VASETLVGLSEGVLAEAFGTILIATEGELRTGETDETPLRAARAWRELTSGYGVDVEALFKTFDADGYDEMIALAGVPYVSLCEHHLLPFTGKAHVVYIPRERLIGLSKIPRVIQAYARRLQVQERLTSQVARALQDNLDPIGLLVVVEGVHSCMCNRGARSDGVMRTSVTKGGMRDNVATRAEAMSLIGL
jgi:GTP cyclohydrolase I